MERKASEIPNHKFQTPVFAGAFRAGRANNLQIPISNDPTGVVSSLDHWDLFNI
jgi:hypothetical protein